MLPLFFFATNNFHMNNCTKLSLLGFFLLMGCLPFSVYAQFDQGTKTLGGGIGYYSEKQTHALADDRESRNFFLNLNGGYMLQENLEAGLNLGFSSYYYRTENKQLRDQESSSNVFSLGPYMRVYYPITEVVGIFGHANINAGFGGGNSYGTDMKSRTFEAGIRPGIILMVNENLGLETTVGFVGYHRNARGPAATYADSRSINNTFQARFDLSTIQFGFRLYLGN
jgi:hypothetical protein